MQALLSIPTETLNTNMEIEKLGKTGKKYFEGEINSNVIHE